jgi:hypothetical protein
MKIVCAWCKLVLGEKEPLEDKQLTHGLCEKCRAEFFPATVKNNKEGEEAQK